MGPATPTPLPGNLTVPPTFGWEHIAAFLLVVSLVGLAFLVVGAIRASSADRSEWQGYLGGRSVRSTGGPDDDRSGAQPADASSLREAIPSARSSSRNR